MNINFELTKSDVLPLHFKGRWTFNFFSSVSVETVRMVILCVKTSVAETQNNPQQKAMVEEPLREHVIEIQKTRVFCYVADFDSQAAAKETDTKIRIELEEKLLI